jgi:hypothetical protein
MMGRNIFFMNPVFYMMGRNIFFMNPVFYMMDRNIFFMNPVFLRVGHVSDINDIHSPFFENIFIN